MHTTSSPTHTLPLPTCTQHPPTRRGLKQLITPVLAGLMENELSKMFEFDDFFKYIEQISRMKVGLSEIHNSELFDSLFLSLDAGG